MKLNGTGKNKVIKIAIASVIGVIMLMMLFWMSKAVYTSSNYYYPTETFVQLENGKPVTLDIEAPGTSPVLRSVSVTFATNARYNEGDVKVELLDGENVLSEWHINASELLDNAIRGFDAEDGIRLNEGGIYTIRITESFEDENNIAVGAASTGNLSCFMTAYDSSRCLKWFVIVSMVFIAGYAILILKGGLLEWPVPKLVITGIVSVLIIFIMEFDLFPRIVTNLAVKPVPSSTGVWDTVAPGQEKEYAFSYYGDAFEELEIFTGGENASDYVVTLTNVTTGTDYFMSSPVSPDRRVSTGRLCMMLSTEDSLAGRRYYENGEYVLKVLNYSPDKALDIELASEPSEGETGIITFAGIRHTDLGIKVMTLALFLMFAYVVVLSLVRHMGALTAERFFLITVIPLSMLYFIVFQPWNVPDCGAHFLASYRISNLFLGIRGDSEWMGRACDAAYYNGASWWVERKPDMAGIANMFYGIRDKAGDVSLVDTLPHDDRMKYYSFVCWLPQSTGFVIGRLAGLGTQMTIVIARLLILAAYIACSYRAIRNTPAGKSVFAALALLPVSLMMSSSFSYDAMVIISVLSFTAVVLKLRKEFTRGALIEAVIWAFVLGAVKGGCGLLVLPMVIILIRKDRKSAVAAGAVAGAALLSVLLFDKVLPSDELFQFGEEKSTTMMTAFAFDNPVEYLRMLVRSYLYFGDTYVNEALGRDLSYLETVSTSLVSAGAFIAACVYATLEKDELELGRKDRAVFTVLSVLSVIIIPAMLLSYTPVGSGMIYGVQGRYFFPVMPVFILAVTKFGLHKTRSGSGEETRASAVNACINVYVTFTVIMVYLMMKMYLSR